MINPYAYNQQPHPIDRAARALEVITYTLRTGSPYLLDSLRNGTDETYTFGVVDITGQLPQLTVSPQVLQREGTGARIDRLFIQTEIPDDRRINPVTAKRLGLKVLPRQLTFRPGNFQIIPAPYTGSVSAVQ